jgi:hypothetical protein
MRAFESKVLRRNFTLRNSKQERMTGHITSMRMRWERQVAYMVNVKLSLGLTKHHSMKTYWGVEA